MKLFRARNIPGDLLLPPGGPSPVTLHALSNQRGFTLLEFMIAFALLTVVLASVFIAQGSALSSSVRSKDMLIATNLARNFINEQEVKFENIPFDRLPLSEEKGAFPEPYQNYKWTIKFEEVDFGAIGTLVKGQTPGEEKTAEMDTVMNLFEEYLKKSVRKMTITVEWPDGKGTTSQSFTELLVNYDVEFTGGA